MAAPTGVHRAEEPSERTSVRVPAVARRAFDVIAVIALAVVAFQVRRAGLPGDGLWFDDSWVAAAAMRGNISQLMTIGTAHPAFTTLLMSVNALGNGGVKELGVPALLAGTAGPVLLYFALRSFHYERAVALVVSAALVVAPIHILYSGRVKPYTFDTLWVIAARDGDPVPRSAHVAVAARRGLDGPGDLRRLVERLLPGGHCAGRSHPRAPPERRSDDPHRGRRGPGRLPRCVLPRVVDED